ncbi:MAG: hypothetical protein LUO97_04990, partial [Methanomicrobiales archaeon]|nr:hypothetical protein [Methanomicrobiales archaeon]
LAFTSSQLLPILSNISSAWKRMDMNLSRLKGHRAKISGIALAEIRSHARSPENPFILPCPS